MNQDAKVWPHSVQAEEAVLGSLLIDPFSYHEISTMISPDDFFIKRNGLIYEAVAALHEQGLDVDLLTVEEQLGPEASQSIGGSAYLLQLLTSTPTSINVETYARRVQQTSIRRQLMQASSQIAQMAHEQNDSAPDVLITNAEGILSGSVNPVHTDAMVSSEVAHSDFYDRLLYRFEHQDEQYGVPSGFRALDEILGGFRPGNLITIAARPGMGKTALLVNMAIRAAKRQSGNILLFSLEMERDELVRRMVSHETGINSELLRDGTLTNEQLDKATHAIAVNSDWPIFIDDDPNGTLELIRSKSRRVHAQHGLSMIMIDYLGLMHADGFGQNNRVQEVTAITSGLKRLSKELECPIVMAHQLNREPERRADKHPVLADLRESGSVEQDSDVVMFIYRDEVYERTQENQGQAEIIIAKHRNGRTGMVMLRYIKQLTRFDKLIMSKG